MLSRRECQRSSLRQKELGKRLNYCFLAEDTLQVAYLNLAQVIRIMYTADVYMLRHLPLLSKGSLPKNLTLASSVVNIGHISYRPYLSYPFNPALRFHSVFDHCLWI